jgi:thymidylate synthase (FAD)
MEVEVLRSTDNPERLVCQAARGDYYEGYVGDTEYADLIENVDYDEDTLPEIVESSDWLVEADLERDRGREAATLEAKTKSFIEKQLDRGHYGPFEHPQITFAIKGVPVFTERQLIRHRHLTFDVQSMRYADFSDAPVTVPESLTDPQHFTREMGSVDMSDRTRRKMETVYENQVEQSFEAYENMVDAGVPKEDARCILPLGTEVNMTVSGNARTMMHVLNLRQKADAQWSIRQLSNEMADELEQWMPFTGQWWADNGPMKLSP